MTFRTGPSELLCPPKATLRPAGWWRSDGSVPPATLASIRDQITDLTSTVCIVDVGGELGLAHDGNAILSGEKPGPNWQPLIAYLPPLPPDRLGDPAFKDCHGVQYAYMTGAMANGIGSVEIVESISRAGMLGAFGAAGLSLERIGQAIDRLQSTLSGKPYCFNLIHSPNEPAHETATADLYLRRGVRTVEASAYLDLTPAIVRYRISGVRRGLDGVPIPASRVIAKVSRVEVATKFLSPPPARILRDLVSSGKISADEADIAVRLPMCDDLTGEADSGGHTDNRPAVTLLPTLIALRDRLQIQHSYPTAVRVGLAGGIATPSGVAAAFAMGAGYVVTGSINQACVESGSSDAVRAMLAEAGQADVTMAPAADMFEMGVKVQVLKRGTMFAMRAQKLYDIYRQYSGWDAVPAADRSMIEKNFLRASFAEVWDQTRDFFARRDPTQLPKAEADPRHKMALVFRWYLGLSSRWANAGEPTRRLDYQVWCGPAMGAFNEWVKGSELEHPENRTVTGVARNLLFGACVQVRRQALRQQGVFLPDACFPLGPLPKEEIEHRLN